MTRVTTWIKENDEIKVKILTGSSSPFLQIESHDFTLTLGVEGEKAEIISKLYTLKESLEGALQIYRKSNFTQDYIEVP
jgi:hypothetical protein